MEYINETVIFVAIIQIISIICFFVIVKDIGSIKRLIQSFPIEPEKDCLIEQYHLAHAFGDREEIIRTGRLLLFRDLSSINKNFNSKSDRIIQYKGIIQAKWQQVIDEYNIPVPDFNIMASL